MRREMLLLLIGAVSVASLSALAQDEKKENAPVTQSDKAEQPAPKTARERASYGIGMNIGRNFKRQGLELDINLLMRGIADALADRESVVSEDDLQEAFTELQKEIQAKTRAKADMKVEDGKKFLAENGKKEGIKTTKSGLQYQVVKAGNGPTPKATDTVTTHYKGRLVDGTVFDGSYEGDAPAAGDKSISFPVNGVIAGWTEALQLMKVGDHWRLFIPSELAYGEAGAGDSIGPNEVLVFDIHLIAIK